jgi:SNF2 family DNA or RNA helicase
MVLSTAINLTECTRVIYFSRNFSYLDWSQSIKRFHRIGSSEPVIINPIISENTLEERVETALRNKKDLDDTIFSKDYLTQEEWKKIFTGNSL